MFIGNQDSDTVAYNSLTPPITARYIRFKPVEWYSHISMRIEIYGCQGILIDHLFVLARPPKPALQPDVSQNPRFCLSATQARPPKISRKFTLKKLLHSSLFTAIFDDENCFLSIMWEI